MMVSTTGKRDSFDELLYGRRVRQSIEIKTPLSGRCTQLMRFGHIGEAFEVSTRSFTVTDDPGRKTVVVKVLAAGVNMSDVKMIKGLMPYVKPPVITGRDYSGVIVQTPPGHEYLLNKEVFGVGARGIGCRSDGTHSQYLHVPVDCVAHKPSTLSHEQAGTLGVPYFTAYEAVVSRCRTTASDIVVVQVRNT